MIAAVFAAPDDDRPRLVYADRLIERGDPRGELIHLQCATRKTATMVARETELLRLHRSGWETPLRRSRVDFHWSRGFPDELIGDGGEVLESLSLACQLAPIRRLTLTSGGQSVVELARRPELGRINELALPGSERFPDWTIGDEGARALAGSAHAGALRALSLGPNGLSDGGMRALADAPWLAQLQRLAVSGNRVEVGPLVRRARSLAALNLTGAVLLEAPFSTSAPLTQLALVECSLRRGAGAVIARTASLARLTSLTLTADLLDAEDVVQLANGPHFGALQVLRLSRNAVHDQGASALARSARLGALRSLELSFASIGAQGIAALAGSSTLSQLRHLNLTGNPLWPASVDALATGAGLPSLRELVLSERDVPESFEVLKRRFAGKPQLALISA